MGIAEKRLAMFDALLSGRGLQGLVDAAAEVLGNPVAVADMGLAMVAVSSELADDPEWTANAREIETNDMRQAALAAAVQRVAADGHQAARRRKTAADSQPVVGVVGDTRRRPAQRLRVAVAGGSGDTGRQVEPPPRRVALLPLGQQRKAQGTKYRYVQLFTHNTDI